MRVYRSRLFSPIADPFRDVDPASTYLYFDDAFVAVDDGKIAAIGAFSDRPTNHEVIDFSRDTLITPGFIDTHLHAPQLEMIGSYGGHLLEWLNRYTFPTEAKFADVNHARRVAAALYDELLRNGTVAALIFSTIHRDATDIFFEEAERRRFRAIIGKTMMDRNAPDALLETADDSYRNSRELLRKWNGRSGLQYAITPRFAPTSTPRLLELAGDLKREFPDVYVQTHVSENRAEVTWVHELFPDAPHYAGVYDRYGLLGDRTILAHGVHLSDDELELLH
ncbi:MAG TPA: guanine deaminase, partial [Thermoanaerobaculia bacterium]